MIVQRVEKHTIDKQNPMWRNCDELCFKSKNLYNYANYIYRNVFISTMKLKNGEDITQEQNDFISEINISIDMFNNYKLNNFNKKQLKGKYKDKEFKKEYYFGNENNVPSYNFMDFHLKQSEPFKKLGSNSAQHTLKILDKNWKSYLVAIKDYWKNSSRYLGEPKIPSYLDKNGRNICVLTNMQSQIKDGHLYFAFKELKQFNNTIRTNIQGHHLQTRIIPRNGCYVLEIVYEIEVPNKIDEINRIVSIDLGVNNLATLTNNIGAKSIIINGKPIKSINQYYNKEKAKIQSELMKTTGKHWSNKLDKLQMKRNNKIDNYIHSSSKSIVEYAIGLEADTIVIGLNKEWKQESKMSDKVNQNFIGIPFDKLIKQITYKAENVGIKVITTNESYTSGTSFLDNEEPIKANYDKSRRIQRGLFKSNEDTLINSDVNGSYQIMKKVVPNAFADGIEGVDLHPVVISL